MSREPIISVSGLRGIVGDTLTPEVAWRYASAFAETMPPGPVVVTRDGRANGEGLVQPIVCGLTQRGARQVLYGGIAATPTTGILVCEQSCAGGVQISASHNPAEYNGMKLFSAEGRVVPSSLGQQVLDRYRALADASGDVTDGPGSSSATSREIEDTTTAHLRRVAATVDVERIRSKEFSVLLDANHGSGSILGAKLLERLGCKVTLLGGNADGLFSHPPEPTAENLHGVLAELKHCGAAIGFCQDPDADRLAIIDERGHYIGEEYTLAICANHRLSRALGPIVTNCSTSRMTEEVARKYGVPFYRSAVGEANVVDEMLRHDAVLGGEGNGGVIDPRVGLVRDSFVAMALVLDAMAARGTAVSALVEELPRYEICKTKLTLSREAMPAAIDALVAHFREAAVDRLDGVRFDWAHADGSGSWLLMRASNTEPIVRAIAEAPTASEAERLCNEAARVMGTRS